MGRGKSAPHVPILHLERLVVAESHDHLGAEDPDPGEAVADQQQREQARRLDELHAGGRDDRDRSTVLVQALVAVGVTGVVREGGRHAVRAEPSDGLQRILDQIREHDVVGREHDRELGRHIRQPLIEGVADTAVRFATNDNRTRAAGREVGDDREGVVGRSVVDEDHIERSGRLRPEAGEHRRQVGSGVVAGHQDRHQRSRRVTCRQHRHPSGGFLRQGLRRRSTPSRRPRPRW